MPEDNLFEQNLNNPEAPVTDEQNIAELNEINENEYLKKVKAKNSKQLIKLDYLEKERIASYIKDLYVNNQARQQDIIDKIDEWDEVWRQLKYTDDDGQVIYRTPLSTVTLEVIHANVMNVFFTPKDIMRVLPTEKGDIPKIQKLDTFGNWSMENEMKIEEGIDRLFHSSGKNGECPYIVHWVKEYGTDIKIEPVRDPTDPSKYLIDPDTKEVITQEKEVEKLLYNGPKLEIFSRKDYIFPENSIVGQVPPWEMRRLRTSADKAKRNELEGKWYDGVISSIGWDEGVADDQQKDKDQQDIKVGKGEALFVEFYGKIRIDALKQDNNDEEIYEELEEEFIGIVEIESETLCSFKKNKFPLKMRPIGLDVLIPKDEGSLGGYGVMEFMESPQKCYDALFNQYLFGTVQANNPTIFFSPMANQKNEPIKIKAGYAYPSSEPQGIKDIKISPPDNSLMTMMEVVRNHIQILWGISDYSAGVESQIDPSAPARKAELVVAQGNVRTNLIIKRKNRTLKDIFKRWFLLYQANMPPNKFMRIAGNDRDNPWKFEGINLSDFALTSIPDFELTGNVLNSNKTLEAQKKLSTYQILIQNPFFSPQTQQGLQSLHALTKWLLDGLDETGISDFLPSPQGRTIHTPEEENALFLQGDVIEPTEGEDHVNHIKVHSAMIYDPTVPEEVKKNIIVHIGKTTELLKQQITQQIVMTQNKMAMPNTQPQGGMNAGQATGATNMPPNTVPTGGMARA